MGDKKINVLFVPSDREGVGHFRTIWPAKNFYKNYSDEFNVKIDASPNFEDMSELEKFDIIHFHRQIGPLEEQPRVLTHLRSKGVKLIMDIDDYWSPPPTHNLYSLIKSEGIDKKIEEVFKYVDMVTTTTEIFKKEILKYHKNVEVVPNALNLNEAMWKNESTENKSGKIRIGWAGGSSHLHDLDLLRESMIKLANSQFKDKVQIVMCGFDVRGTNTIIGPNGEKTTIPIQKHETLWLEFEKIFTGNYSLINQDQEYVKWLKKIVNEEYPKQSEKSYLRRWTLPLTRYGEHYDYFDVCIVPLAETYRDVSEKGQVTYKENIFNKVKSELKIIESGFKKKVLIAQKTGIYEELLTDGENAILVDDNKKGWYKAIGNVASDAELREKLSTNLHKFVTERYTIEKVNEKRKEIYQKIMQPVLLEA